LTHNQGLPLPDIEARITARPDVATPYQDKARDGAKTFRHHVPVRLRWDGRTRPVTCKLFANSVHVTGVSGDDELPQLQEAVRLLLGLADDLPWTVNVAMRNAYFRLPSIGDRSVASRIPDLPDFAQWLNTAAKQVDPAFVVVHDPGVTHSVKMKKARISTAVVASTGTVWLWSKTAEDMVDMMETVIVLQSSYQERNSGFSL
jgi:hypothetical protein